ncbi:MFS transporter [Lysinibacillus sp. BW-2-10]|uniref:MFS transporter n=1 Tax=Lysinibacillus sp. BW-2-10 TaxID=2590030 RepID=UPI00117FC002|nr:MFS transporter [Lysinibacillus sp. BW-2-10]TSI02299.1 MFS transporter [Lysinibacillus sp. BW-2-10]
MEPKLWTKEFIVTSFVNFLLTIMYFLLMVTMSNYAVETYDVTVSTAGLVASIFVLGSLLGRLLVGKFIARFGMLNVLVFGLLGAVLVSLSYFFANGVAAFLLIRMLHGFTVGLVSTTTGTICVQTTPSARKGEGISYYSLSAVLGTAIGPFIGMLLINLNNGFEWMFALNIMAGVVCILLLKIVRLRLPESEKPVVTEKTKAFSVSDYIDKQAVPISLLMLTIGFGFSSVTSYLTLYGKETGLIEAVGYFFFIHSICVICSRPFTGKMIDARGANIIVYPCMLLFATGMFVYSQSTATWMIIMAAACMGLGFGNFNSAAQIIALKNADPSRLALATATYFIFLDLGFGLGPYILGHIIQGVGFRSLYMVISCIGLLCIPIYYLIYGNKEKQAYASS